METFIWTPEFGAGSDVKDDVTTVKFGDGYEQRFAKGINSQSEILPLTFAQRDPAEGNALWAFLLARGGVEAFLFTPPGDSAPKKFKCTSKGRTYEKGGRWTIRATFEQVFQP